MLECHAFLDIINLKENKFVGLSTVVDLTFNSLLCSMETIVLIILNNQAKNNISIKVCFSCPLACSTT